jgi:thiamine biosynthesis lipoprotein
MGSPLRLTIVGSDSERAAAAWAAVSALTEDIEKALSRFRETSDLTGMNRRAGSGGRPAGVTGWLARALAAADRACRVTGGAFDPRVLGDLERLGSPGAPLGPESGRSASAGERTNATGAGARAGAGMFDDGRWLHLEPRRATAAVAVPVDLGGIGKGLALRWARRALARTLPSFGDQVGALLEAEGDLVAAGPAPQDGPWLVGVEDPRGRTADPPRLQYDPGPRGDDPPRRAEVAVIAVTQGTVATSSVRVHAWAAADGSPVHHLLDPCTGEPGGAELLAVTVAGPEPAWAEVWSKHSSWRAPHGSGGGRARWEWRPGGSARTGRWR